MDTYSFNITAGNSVTSIWFACTTTFSLNWHVTMLKSVNVLNKLFEAPIGSWLDDLIVLCTDKYPPCKRKGIYKFQELFRSILVS